VKVGTTGLSEDLRKEPGCLQDDFTDQIPTAMRTIYHEVFNRGKEYLRWLMTSCGSLHPLCGQHDVGCAHQRQVFYRQPALKNSFASTIRTRPTRCRTMTLPTDENFHVQRSTLPHGYSNESSEDFDGNALPEASQVTKWKASRTDILMACLIACRHFRDLLHECH